MGVPIEKISVKILLDVNVVLDVLLVRNEFRDSAKVLNASAGGKIEAYIPLHPITTIYYFLRKEMPDSDSRALIQNLLNWTEVIQLSKSEVRNALSSRISDFEDAVVSESASVANANYILSRNERDFKYSVIEAITPTEFLHRHGANFDTKD